MKKKQKLSREEALKLYKTYVPCIAPKAEIWEQDQDGIVTIHIENKGLMNVIFQKILRKPRVSYVHLDAQGSFVWKLCNGSRTIEEIAEAVHREFGEAADPLYERLLKFFEITESYDFVSWKREQSPHGAR